jgi:modulator of FtsH protease
MDATDLESWQAFASASAGTAGALAGLIIVAISVNVKQILAGSALPARAGSTIAAIAVILVSALAMIIPGQSLDKLGYVVLGFGVVALAFQVDAAVRMLRSHDGPSLSRTIPTIVLHIGQLSGVLVGSIMLISANPDGLFHIAWGFIAIFIVSILNAWVLMVEILR